MKDGYFRHERSEIAPLLPATATRIVDVGCGAGATAMWLKERYHAAHVVGLEGNPALRSELDKCLDEVHIVDLNGPLPDVGVPDVVLFLDVLEHLVKPEVVLATLTAAMPPHGTVIVSLPNVAHLSVSLPLLRGQFTYRDAGILDRTHLRFFVRDTAVALMNSAGLIVERGLRSGLQGHRSRILDYASCGLLREHLTKQYILAGRRAAAGTPQGPILWRTA
jgi:2-polyprenyl-3-methyl-5-hydroxy-6-metoxy-1,4-benzoquinol methylase